MEMAAIAMAMADTDTTQMDAKHCAVQCREWQATLDRTYLMCMQSARIQDHLSMVSSGLIIVLNVVIVGAKDLQIEAFIVSIFVIVMSVLKALQMKFQYDVCGSELHACKAQIRSVKISVKELLNEAECTGKASMCQFNIMRDRVSQAIEAVPNYISVEPSAPRGWHMPGSATTPVANASELVKTAKDIEAPTPRDPKVVKEACHMMMPPADMADKDAAKDATKDAAKEAAKEAASIALEVKARAVAAKTEVEKVILADMLKFLQTAEPVIGRAAAFLGLIIAVTTTVELALNALIMAFKNISSLADLGDAVAIFASVNAVQKGLLMKLDLDVKRNTVLAAQTKVTTLMQKVKQETLNLEATGEIKQAALVQLKKDYQSIIEKYASFLPR